MIARLSGEVVETYAGAMVLDVGGVGYEVHMPTPDIETLTLHDTAMVFTYHHVREQAEELFGFSTLKAKKIFELLIGVQGVGPRAALAILSLSDAEAVRNAIAQADAMFIQKAAGVGKKTAERVVVDLRDKVGVPTTYGRGDDSTIEAPAARDDEALEALMALGYSLADATKALAKVDQSLPVEQRITEALKG